MLAQQLPSTAHSPAENCPSSLDQISGRSDRVKRVLDVIVGLGISVIAGPIILAAWVLVKVTSEGPGFYSQVRVGRDGRNYRIYKIRSMYHNCEAGTGAAWCTKSDRRVTTIGRILRKLHIDELPQLLNVLRGDMSLVGPRPERPEFVGPLAAAIPGYADRLAVRPGITGLAQIQLPPDSDLESVRKKLVLDRCYAQTGGLWLDFRLILGTVLYLFGFSYIAVRKALWLPDPLAEERKSDDTRNHIVLCPLTLNGFSAEQSRAFGVEGRHVQYGESK